MRNGSSAATRLRLVLTAGMLGWALVLFLAPYVSSRADAPAGLRVMAMIPYAIGTAICHQKPSRSFFLWSRQLPVCARCTGLYVGAAVIALGLVVIRRSPERLALRPSGQEPERPALRPSGREPERLGPHLGSPEPDSLALHQTPAIQLVLLAALVTLATLAYELTTGVMTSNVTRGVAGFLLGASSAFVVLTSLTDQVN